MPLALVAALGTLAAVPAPADAKLVARLDAALSRSAGYLLAAQQPDGSWRSRTYGAFKDGLSLTPWVAKALWFSGDERAAPAVERARDYLARSVAADGGVLLPEEGMSYPIYSAAGAAMLLNGSAQPSHHAARDAFLAFLRARQLDEQNGWSPTDVSYGGWGYWLGDAQSGFAVPRRPAVGAPIPELLASNLSSTVFALGALRMCGASEDDPAVVKARRFVERCQNFAAAKKSADPRFDDGGFFFTPANDFQNKAASGGTDRLGRVRYRSYGSMTADGLRGLLRAGHPVDSPRVKAAFRWLERRWNGRRPPGDYPRIREVQRDSVRFYFAWSAAHALRALGRNEAPDARTRAFVAVLAQSLLDEQRPDGSFKNAATDMREDDPLLATPLAMAALATARQVLVAMPR